MYPRSQLTCMWVDARYWWHGYGGRLAFQQIPSGYEKHFIKIPLVHIIFRDSKKEKCVFFVAKWVAVFFSIHEVRCSWDRISPKITQYWHVASKMRDPGAIHSQQSPLMSTNIKDILVSVGALCCNINAICAIFQWHPMLLSFIIDLLNQGIYYIIHLSCILSLSLFLSLSLYIQDCLRKLEYCDKVLYFL